MGEVIVQLGDIHLSAMRSNNPVLDRVESIAGAVRQITREGDDCFLVVCGDLANWGLPDEYTLAKDFLFQLVATVGQHVGESNIRLIIVPGNHDLLFEPTDQSARETLIETVGDTIPPSFASICLQPQAPYRDCVQELGSVLPDVLAAIDIQNSKIYDLEQRKIKFVLLNTPWASRKEEQPASLPFPVDELRSVLGSPGNNEEVVIAVFHHPYYWLSQSCSRAMQHLLEQTCDLILTGHEHDAISRSVDRGGQSSLYSEGGVLQDSEVPDESSFNILRISEEEVEFKCWTFRLDGGVYLPTEEEGIVYKSLRRRSENKASYPLATEWEHEIDHLGWDFRHPRCETLTLSQLFCYPDCSVLDVAKGFVSVETVLGRDMLAYVLAKKKVYIAGGELSGKTCLAKKLFRDMRDNGYTPLMLGKQFRLPDSRRGDPYSTLQSELSEQVKKIYGSSAVSRFWQLRKEARAVIVDDFNLLNTSIVGRDSLVKWLEEKFGLVLLLGDNSVRLDNVLTEEQVNQSLWRFAHLNLLDAGHSFRSELITKWVEAGQNPYDSEYDTLRAQIAQYEHAVDQQINGNTLPPIPLFIMMLLQQLDSPRSIDTSVGIHGHLYEQFIRDRLLANAPRGADYRIQYNYLCRLAYHLWEQDKRSISNAEYDSWHISFCTSMKQPIDCVRLEHLIEGGLLGQLDGEVFFRSKYYFCFFVAAHIANLHEAGMADHVVRLCEALHIRDSARIMMFLCHLIQNPIILTTVIAASQKHFQGDEYNLLHCPNVLPAIKPSEHIVDSTVLQDEARQLRVEADQIERSTVMSDDENYVDMPDLLCRFNAAQNTLQLFGQILRNFYGTIEGETQEQLITSCISLGLRTLHAVYSAMEKSGKELAVYIASQLKRLFPTWKDEELDDRTTAWMQGMVVTIAFGIVKSTGDAIGVRQLQIALDDLLKSSSTNASHKITNVASRLDYFGRFPAPEIAALRKELHADSFGDEILKHLVRHHLHVFPYYQPRELQKICALLGFQYKPSKFLSRVTAKALPLEAPEEIIQ